MKTIKEWLEELPEPYRTQAINNTSESDLMIETKSLYETISAAFIWSRSQQGHEYWSEFRDSL